MAFFRALFGNVLNLRLPLLLRCACWLALLLPFAFGHWCLSTCLIFLFCLFLVSVSVVLASPCPVSFLLFTVSQFSFPSVTPSHAILFLRFVPESAVWHHTTLHAVQPWLQVVHGAKDSSAHIMLSLSLSFIWRSNIVHGFHWPSFVLLSFFSILFARTSCYSLSSCAVHSQLISVSVLDLSIASQYPHPCPFFSLLCSSHHPLTNRSIIISRPLLSCHASAGLFRFLSLPHSCICCYCFLAEFVSHARRAIASTIFFAIPMLLFVVKMIHREYRRMKKELRKERKKREPITN